MNFCDNFNHFNFAVDQSENINIENDKFIYEISDYFDFFDHDQILYLMNL